MDKKESKSQDDDGWTDVVSKKTIKKKKYQKKIKENNKEKKYTNAVIGSREYVEQKNYIPRKNTWINAKNKLKFNPEK